MIRWRARPDAAMMPIVLSARLHGALDELVMWSEDRRARAPEPVRLSPPAPLSCFGPLPPLPAPPAGAGRWSAPSPRPRDPDDRMSVRIAAAHGARRGTTLLVPPWKIARPALVAGYVRLLRRSGQEVWLVSPPHHLERTLPGGRSGEGFVSLDLARLRAVFEQLVLELRVLAAVAARRGPVGLVGLSLGGLAGALAATAPERLDWAALVAPAHLGLALTETRLGRRYLRLAALAGAPVPSAVAIAGALEPLDPSRRVPTARRVLVAGASYDRVVPPAGPAALARAWGAAPALYPRGHMSLLFLCGALRRDLARFVREGGTRRGE